MKFKIGDKVRIREWEDMVEEYGVNSIGNISPPRKTMISPPMKKFCGKESAVSGGQDKDGDYRLEIDDEKWYWPECTLLPVAEKGEER